MDLTTVGILGICILLLIIFFFRVPVGFAMAFVGALGFALCVNFKAAVGMVGEETWKVFSSYGLTVIPLFILMGQICFYSGLNKKMYKCANIILGETKGGLGLATIVACAGFSAICGSNTATAATMATVALPEMKKYNYDPGFSAGIVAVGATLGVMIPPSVVLIIIGLQTGQSIRDLFLGAIIPGIILAIIFMISIVVVCKIKSAFAPFGDKYSLKEKLMAILGFWEVAILFFLVIGGLSIGIFTPSEAGAAGSFIALVMSLLRKTLTMDGLKNAILDTMKISCMIYVIILGAVIFGRFLTITRIPYDTATFVASLDLPNWIIMSFVFFIYLMGGAIMDALALLLITIPIFFPIANSLGYDPIWFSVWITLITTMGAVTPPVGINVFIVSAMDKDLNITKVIKGILYFIPGYLFVIFVLLGCPKLATWLPFVLG